METSWLTIAEVKPSRWLWKTIAFLRSHGEGFQKPSLSCEAMAMTFKSHFGLLKAMAMVSENHCSLAKLW